MIRRDRLKLLGIFAVAAVPVVLAMAMYFGQVGLPSGTTNHGDLVLPPVDAAKLVNLDQTLDTPDPWTLLVLGDGPCDQVCMDSLYKIQQVNVALGRDANRVRHMLLALDQSALELADLKVRYPGLQILQAERPDVNAVFQPGTKLNAGSYDVFLVDPLGNLMMHYESAQTGHDILDDLKKLLRVSKIG